MLYASGIGTYTTKSYVRNCLYLQFRKKIAIQDKIEFKAYYPDEIVLKSF